MSEYTVSVRLKADGSGLVGETRMAAKEVAALIEQVRRYSTAQAEQIRVVAQRDQAGRKFIDGLRDEIRQLTLSESAMLRYKAAQAGVLGSAGPLIAQIEALKSAQAAQSAQTDRAGASLLSLRAILPGVFGAASIAGVVSFTHSLVEAGLAAQRVRQGLAFATGGAEAGAQSYQRLRATVYELGLELNSTAGSYMRFQAASQGTALQGQQAEHIFRAVAGATTVLGLSAAETNGVFQALQQMMSKGSVQAEELRGQLGERLPGAFQIAARAMGVTTGELGKMLESGSVAAADFLPKFAAEMERTFAGALPAATKSAQSEINRFSSAWTEMKQTLAESGVLSTVAEKMSAISRAMREVNAAAREAKDEGAWEQFKVMVGGAMANAPGAVMSFAPRGRQPGDMFINGRWVSQTERASQAANAAALGQQGSMQSELEAIAPAANAAMNDAMVRGLKERARALNELDKATAEYLPKQEKMRREIAEMERQFAGKGIDADLQRAIAQVRTHYLNEGKTQTSDYTRLVKSANDFVAALNKEAAQLGMTATQKKLMATEGVALTLKTQAERDAVMAAARAWADKTDAYEKIIVQQERDKKAREETLKVIERMNQQARTTIEAANKEAEAIEEQVHTYGLAKDAVLELSIARLEERKLFYSQFEDGGGMMAAIDREIAARRALIGKLRSADFDKAAKKSADAQIAEEKRAANEIERLIGDSLMRGFEQRGMDSARALADGAVALFKTLVLRPTIQPIAQAGANMVLDAAGWIGRSIAGSAVGSYVTGAASSFYAGYQGATLATGLAGPTTVGATGAMGMGATVGSGMSTVMAAVPYIAAAVAAYYLLTAEDDKPRNPWMSINTDGQGGPVGTLAVTQTDLAGGDDVRQWQEANAWLDQLPDQVKSAVDNLGLVFEPGTSSGVGWAAMQAAIMDVAQSLGLTVDEMQKLAPLAAQNLRSQLEFSLMTSEEQLAKTTENLQKTFTDLGVAMPATNKELENYVRGLDLTTESGLRALEAVNQIAPAFLQMTSAADQAAEATRRAAEAAQQSEIDRLKATGTAIMQLIGQIDQAAASSSASFADSIRSIRYGVLDDAGKYAFLDKEIADLQNQIRASTGYQTTADLAGKLNADIMAAWALIPRDQQAAKAEDFVNLFEGFNALAQQQFATNKADKKAGEAENVALLKQALKEERTEWIAAQNVIVAAQTAAVATQQAAANTALQAANTPITVRVDSSGNEVGA